MAPVWNRNLYGLDEELKVDVRDNPDSDFLVTRFASWTSSSSVSSGTVDSPDVRFKEILLNFDLPPLFSCFFPNQTSKLQC
jgi:hypothetical protein